jgi:hypothetical protein
MRLKSAMWRRVPIEVEDESQPGEIGRPMQEVWARLKRLNIFLYQSSITPVFGVRSRQLPLSTAAFLSTLKWVLQQNEWNGIVTHNGTEKGGARPRRGEMTREPF